MDAYIRINDIAAELVFAPSETPSVALAARAMDCAEDQIVKSVLFLVKHGEQAEAVMIMTNGTAQIDFRKLASVFGIGRKRIRLAPTEVVLAHTGFPAGGGDDKTLLRTTPAELVRVTGAQIIDAREENG